MRDGAWAGEGVVCAEEEAGACVGVEGVWELHLFFVFLFLNGRSTTTDIQNRVGLRGKGGPTNERLWERVETGYDAADGVYAVLQVGMRANARRKRLV